MFISRGRIVLECSMEECEARYVEVSVHPAQIAAGRALQPIHERQVLGRNILLFDLKRAGADATPLAENLHALGEVRTPSIADLFVAVMGNRMAGAQGVAQ
jgi:ABC-2 type transport system ATP-binding protein